MDFDSKKREKKIGTLFAPYKHNVTCKCCAQFGADKQTNKQDFVSCLFVCLFIYSRLHNNVKLMIIIIIIIIIIHNSSLQANLARLFIFFFLSFFPLAN